MHDPEPAALAPELLVLDSAPLPLDPEFSRLTLVPLVHDPAPPAHDPEFRVLDLEPPVLDPEFSTHDPAPLALDPERQPLALVRELLGARSRAPRRSTR